jgi:hypothetical protein
MRAVSQSSPLPASLAMLLEHNAGLEGSSVLETMVHYRRLLDVITDEPTRQELQKLLAEESAKVTGAVGEGPAH